jgi:hypothetical protein
MEIVPRTFPCALLFPTMADGPRNDVSLRATATKLSTVPLLCVLFVVGRVFRLVVFDGSVLDRVVGC